MSMCIRILALIALIAVTNALQQHKMRHFVATSLVGLGSLGFNPDMAMARPEGVNKPELLPQGQTVVPLIDTGNFLVKGQVSDM